MSAARALLMLRHGRTAWNEQGRIQGRRDVALERGVREELAARRLPEAWRGAGWVCSPLARARETARALGAGSLAEAPALIEMDWGAWEGSTLRELRARDRQGMARNEARGLDFRPQAGESPREVRERLSGWVRALDPAGPPLVAVTHKGVIRAALSLATGWDMTRDFPQRVLWDHGQCFAREPDGGLRLRELNVPLAPASAAVPGRRGEG